MDITMIGLQNAGKTSLLRVLAVSVIFLPLNERRVAQQFDASTNDPIHQGGEFTIE